MPVSTAAHSPERLNASRLSQLGRESLWEEVLVALDRLPPKQAPNVVLYTAAVHALSNGQQRLRALQTFARLRRRLRSTATGKRLDAMAFGAAMGASDSWARARAYLCEMGGLTIEVAAMSFNSALSIFHGAWAPALQCLRLAMAWTVRCNEVTFNSAVAISQWWLGLQLLSTCKAGALELDVIGCNSIISKMAQSDSDLWKQSAAMLSSTRLMSWRTHPPYNLASWILSGDWSRTC